jgi:hypothetical protein
MTARIVRNMPVEDYCAVKALSASGAYTLVKKCPKIFWWSSPWNPDFEHKQKKEFDLGSAVHFALLQPHLFSDQIVVVDANDWRKKAAQEQRESAYAAGRVPLLPKDLDTVEEIVKAARNDPWVSDLLDGAETEVSYFWNAAGAPCKARFDLATRDGTVFADIKAAHSADPEDIKLTIDALGWFLRDPWYRDGWEIVTGNHIQRYFFVVIDYNPPHVITVCDLSERAIEWGRTLIGRALRLFTKCMHEGTWPSFSREPITIDLAARTEWRLAEQEASGILSTDDVRRSIEWLTP